MHEHSLKSVMCKKNYNELITNLTETLVIMYSVVNMCTQVDII